MTCWIEIRWLSFSIILFVFGCAGGRPVEREQGRTNIRWLGALEPSPTRYSGLSEAQLKEVRIWESRFSEIMDGLTIVDRSGYPHGSYHCIKPELELELWFLLKSLPRYSAAPAILLAAIDDIYLGFHPNGWWGYRWHWPYLDCSKAIELADRLALGWPELEEEALWTKIYCYRVKGWAEVGYENGRTDVEPQIRWKSDLERVQELCGELKRRYPRGKYASRAAALSASSSMALTLPSFMILGRRRPAEITDEPWSKQGVAGPPFLIDRYR